MLSARALTKNDGLSKVRNSLWLGKGTKKIILFGCRRDWQSRKQTVGENVFRFKARGYLRTFEPTYDFLIFRLADPGCISFFQKQLKTQRLRRPGPARSGCGLGLGRDVCFGGRSREGSVLDRFCSESLKHVLPLTNVAESSRGGTPQK